MNRTLFLKSSVVVTIFILLFTASYAKNADIPLKIKDSKKAAEQLVKKGAYAEAVEKHQKTITGYPNTEYAMEAQREIATIRIISQDAVGADAAVQQLLNEYADQPEIARSVRIISWEYMKANQPEKVIQLCQQGLSRWPKHSEAFNLRRNLAVAYVLTGEDAQAEAETAKLLSDYSGNAGLPKCLRMIAEAHHQKEHYNEATDLLLQLTRSWPKNKEEPLAIKELKGLTIRHIQQGNYQQADMIVTSLLNSQCRSSRVGHYAYRIGEAYFAQKEYGKAKEVCQRVLKDWPDCSERHKTVWILLSSLIELGEYDQAVKVATNTIKRSEDYEHSGGHRLFAHEALADIYARTGKTVLAEKEVALADAERDGILQDYIQDSHPAAILEFSEVYYDRAMIELQFGRNEQANTNFRKAISIWERSIEQFNDPYRQSIVWYHLGIAHQNIGQKDKAVECYQEVVTKWPDYEKAWDAQFMIVQICRKLKQEGKISDADASLIISSGCKNILENYPDCPVVEIAQRWFDQEKAN